MTNELIKKLDQLFADSINEDGQIEGLAAFQMTLFTLQTFAYEGNVNQLYSEMGQLLNKYFPQHFTDPYLIIQS